MNRTRTAATVLALAGMIAVSVATPSSARNGRVAAGVIGFAAGTMLGAAATSSYQDPYYGEAYAYEPGYAYAPSHGIYGRYYNGNDPSIAPYGQAVENRHDPYGIRGCATEGAYRPDYTLC
jgi:hypothetical protein